MEAKAIKIAVASYMSIMSFLLFDSSIRGNYSCVLRRVRIANQSIAQDQIQVNENILQTILREGEQGSIIIDKETGIHIARLSISGKRILSQQNLSFADILEGVDTGRYEIISQQELIDKALEHRESCGIGITGGGDCAGIGSFLAAFYNNLPEGFTMLGVKKAGEGLSVTPEEFRKQLILIDPLISADIEKQSSTPLGSSRVEPFKANEENTISNLAGWGFFYGTGGNDHLGLLEKISQRFPDMVVVGTFKSIDGDGTINDKPAQMLGFSSAVGEYHRMIYNAAQNAVTHSQIHVIESMGRGSGNLPYHAAQRYPAYFNQLSLEEQRKVIDCRDSIMVLVPEKDEESASGIYTTLRSIADEAMKIRDEEGSVVVVVAEGFMPPEMRSEMKRLAADELLKEDWLSGRLPVDAIPYLIQVEDENDPRNDLRLILRDNRALAAKFAKTVWESKLDPHGNVAKLAGISDFIIQALHTLGGAGKVNKLSCSYEGRGATPNNYDVEMGTKAGEVAATVVRDRITGGRAVVYFDLAGDGPTDPFSEYPIVVPLVGVGAKNDLSNPALYTEEELRTNGVFWNVNDDLSRYFGNQP